jgi:DNA-directed RNA polymerase specialized sigma24 family protein
MDIKRLRELAITYNAKEISKILELPYTTVRYYLRKHRIKTKKPGVRTDFQNQVIVRFSQEHGIKDSAKFYNLSPNVIKAIRYRHKRAIKKSAKNLSQNSALKLRHKAFRYAYKSGVGEYAEDFANYCVLRRLQGQGSDINFMLTDYKRETFGATRSTVGAAKVKAEFDPIDINEVEIEAPKKESVSAIINEFKWGKTHRPIYLLHYYFGLLLNDIALCFDVTESRVSQILTEAQESLQRQITKKGMVNAE